MKEVKIDKCPFCGGEELIETRFDSYGGTFLSPVTKGGWRRGASVYATVCRDCGSIARVYCKTPETLFPKKERRE